MATQERLKDKKTRKVSLYLLEQDITDLREIAEARNCSMTEAVQGVIATEAYIRQIYRLGAIFPINDYTLVLR